MVEGCDVDVEKVGKRKKGKKPKSPRLKKGKPGKKSLKKKGKKRKKKRVKEDSIKELTVPPPSEVEEELSKKVGYQEMVEFGEETAVMAKPTNVDQTCSTIWKRPVLCQADSINVIKAPCSRFGHAFCMESCGDTKPVCSQNVCLDPKCREVCLRLAREQLGRDLTERDAQAKICLERLSFERDYYRSEFERLLKFFEKLGQPNEEEDNELYCIACRKKNEIIEYLQKENEVLSKEKYCYIQQAIQLCGTQAGAADDSQLPYAKCNKASCKRMERERDMLKLDIQRLEDEVDALQEKIKVMNEARTRDFAKFQEERCDFENTITKLDAERKELIKGQGIRRATINSLEQKLNTYTNLMRSAHEEVHRHKLQYCQLKKLHEQCDKALLDTQAQLVDVEAQLSECQNQAKDKGAYRKKRGTCVSFMVNGSEEGLPPCPCPQPAKEPSKCPYCEAATQPSLSTCRCYETATTPSLSKCRCYGTATTPSLSKCRCYGAATTPSLSKCQCFDAATTPEGISFASDDVKRKLQQMDQNRDELLDVLDRKTEELAACEIKMREKDEIIAHLDEEIANFRNEFSTMEDVIRLLKQKCHKSEMELREKDLKIETLHTQTDEKLVEMKNIQTLLEEKNLQNKILQAECECLNKETCTLANANTQLNQATQESKVQISVAMETVNDFENKNKRLECKIADLECLIQTMRLDLDDYQIKLKRKEVEIAQLRNNSQNLEDLSEKLNMENQTREKKICDLECKCQRLATENNNKICEIMKCNEALERKNAELCKKIRKIENKLFNCICCICEDIRDKCLIAKCVFEENDENGCGTNSSPETKGENTSVSTSKCVHHSAKCSNSIKQVLSAKPLREKSSNVITSQSTLPGAGGSTANTDNESLVASLYQSVDPTAPFYYKSPLNVIVEERSSDSFFNDNENTQPSCSRLSTLYGSVEEKGKYVIDNVTSICKIVQVDTLEKDRKNRYD